MTITESQRKRIFGKLRQLEETAWRDEYAYEASNGRTASVAKLTTEEAHIMLATLSDVEQGLRKPCNPTGKYADRFVKMVHTIEPVAIETPDQQLQRLLNSVFRCCHQLGWYRKDEEGILLLKNGKPILDYARIDAFCEKHGHYHKRLNRHTIEELTGRNGLIRQFEIMKQNTIYKEQKPWKKNDRNN